MPSWRDTLEGLQDGSIPPPTPEQSGGSGLAEITALASDVAALADLLAASGKGFVDHGATAGMARPAGYASVEWFGSVEPDNAIDGDSWVSTA